MPEPTADDLTRSAVLGALAEKAKQDAAPKSSSLDEVNEKTPFSELLEKSLAKRAELSEETTQADDDARKKAIKESKVDMIGDIMKRLR